mgnify:CR=1 FL=1
MSNNPEQEKTQDKEKPKRKSYSEGESVDAIPVTITYTIKNSILEKARIVIGWDAIDITIELERIGRGVYKLQFFDNAPTECLVQKDDLYLIKELKKYLRSEKSANLVIWLKDIIEYVRTCVNEPGDY